MDVMPGAEPFSFMGGRTGVLLVHGFTGNPQSLRPWGEFLRDAGLTVSCPLLPGHGTDWKDLSARTYPEWVATAQGALEELSAHCPTVVVMGLSMGGTLTLHLAATNPDRVKGLVLVNASVVSKDPRLKILGLLKLIVPSVKGVGNDVKGDDFKELAYDRIPLRALSSFVQLQGLVLSELAKIHQPVRIFVSREDHVVEPENAALIASAVSSQDIRTAWLENSYHVATLDNDRMQVFGRSLEFVRSLAAS
jgi:carboxylesterase